MTLIETLIYFALLSLLIVGIMGTSLALNANNSKLNQLAKATREGDFIVHVIDNLISFHHVISPTAGNQASTLEVTDSQQSDMKTSVLFDNGTLWLKHGNEPVIPLSTNNTAVSNFTVKLDENQQIIIIEFQIYGQAFSLTRAVNL